MSHTDVHEVVIRYYSRHLLRSLNANAILERSMERFPDVHRIVFEPMSEAERSQAAYVDADQIICIQNRLFVYASGVHGLLRVNEVERDVEQAGM